MVLDAEGISRGSGETFFPLLQAFPLPRMLLHGTPPTLLTHALINLYGPGPYVAGIFCGRFIFGQAEPPPQLVNQTGGFHNADGTNQPGGSLLHWTYTSLSPSLLVFPFATFHSWEGPFRHVSIGLLP